MEKRTKLGIAATSLAAAATMIGPTTASAQEACVTLCEPAPRGPVDVFYKLSDSFDDIYYKITTVAPESVYLKLQEPFLKLSDFFLKFNVVE